MKAERPKTLTVGRVESLYRFEGSDRERNLSGRNLQRTLKTAQGKSRGKTEVNSILLNTVIFMPPLVLGWGVKMARSSEQERRVNARALIAEEGRDKLRKAMGSRK